MRDPMDTTEVIMTGQNITIEGFDRDGPISETPGARCAVVWDPVSRTVYEFTYVGGGVPQPVHEGHHDVLVWLDPATDQASVRRVLESDECQDRLADLVGLVGLEDICDPEGVTNRLQRDTLVHTTPADYLALAIVPRDIAEAVCTAGDLQSAADHEVELARDQGYILDPDEVRDWLGEQLEGWYVVSSGEDAALWAIFDELDEARDGAGDLHGPVQIWDAPTYFAGGGGGRPLEVYQEHAEAQ